ncbi:O-antigen ligase family protein [Hathewaya histolytica]|uniref:O-antigen ligase family protein n=1 Tax=Hathewaya histolytica TaxID=1498 RepID=UPI003B66F208
MIRGVYKDKFLLILAILIITSSIITHNYVNSILFFGCYILTMRKINVTSIYDKLFYVLILTSIFQYTLFLPYLKSIYFFHIALFIFTFMNAYKLLKSDIRFTTDKKVTFFYVLWYIYIVLSFFIAKNRMLSLKYIVIYSITFIFLFNIVVYLDSTEKLNKLIKVIEIMFLVSLIIGILAPLAGIQLPIEHYYDNFSQYKLSAEQIAKVNRLPIAFFYNPNDFGTFITMFLPLFSYKAIINSQGNRIKHIFYIIFSVVVLILTTSRFNIIALIFMLFLAIIFYMVNSKHRKKAIIYSISIIFICSLILVIPIKIGKNTVYVNKIKNMKDEVINIKKGTTIGKAGSVNVRITLYYDIIKGVLKDKNLLGFGVGNSSEYIKSINNTHKTYNPHSWLLEIMGDFGIFILGLYIIYFIYVLKKLLYIYKTRDKNTKTLSVAFIISLLGFIFSSFSPSSIVYFLPHWILFAVIISFIGLNNAKRRN